MYLRIVYSIQNVYLSLSLSLCLVYVYRNVCIEEDLNIYDISHAKSHAVHTRYAYAYDFSFSFSLAISFFLSLYIVCIVIYTHIYE